MTQSLVEINCIHMFDTHGFIIATWSAPGFHGTPSAILSGVVCSVKTYSTSFIPAKIMQKSHVTCNHLCIYGWHSTVTCQNILRHNDELIIVSHTTYILKRFYFRSGYGVVYQPKRIPCLCTGGGSETASASS